MWSTSQGNYFACRRPRGLVLHPGAGSSSACRCLLDQASGSLHTSERLGLPCAQTAVMHQWKVQLACSTSGGTILTCASGRRIAGNGEQAMQVMELCPHALTTPLQSLNHCNILATAYRHDVPCRQRGRLELLPCTYHTALRSKLYPANRQRWIGSWHHRSSCRCYQAWHSSLGLLSCACVPTLPCCARQQHDGHMCCAGGAAIWGRCDTTQAMASCQRTLALHGCARSRGSPSSGLQPQRLPPWVCAPIQMLQLIHPVFTPFHRTK